MKMLPIQVDQDIWVKEEITSIENSADTGYSKYTNLVQGALGTLEANNSYFLASRGGADLGPVRHYIYEVSNGKVWKSYSASAYSVRPIIVLKSGLIIKSGSGTLASPYQIQ